MSFVRSGRRTLVGLVQELDLAFDRLIGYDDERAPFDSEICLYHSLAIDCLEITV